MLLHVSVGQNHALASSTNSGTENVSNVEHFMLTARAGYFNSFSLVFIRVVNGCFSFVNVRKLSLNIMEHA